MKRGETTRMSLPFVFFFSSFSHGLTRRRECVNSFLSFFLFFLFPFCFFSCFSWFLDFMNSAWVNEEAECVNSLGRPRQGGGPGGGAPWLKHFGIPKHSIEASWNKVKYSCFACFSFSHGLTSSSLTAPSLHQAPASFAITCHNGNGRGNHADWLREQGHGLHPFLDFLIFAWIHEEADLVNSWSFTFFAFFISSFSCFSWYSLIPWLSWFSHGLTRRWNACSLDHSLFSLFVFLHFVFFSWFLDFLIFAWINEEA